MPRTLQLKRYANTVVANTTGASGELIIDSTNLTITVHDGSTIGGRRIATEPFVSNSLNLFSFTVNSEILLTQSAFNRANIAYVVANNGYNLANTLANVIANTTMSTNASSNIAIAAFNQANAANILAQNVYNYANTINAYTYSSNTFLQANDLVIWTYANSSFTQANSANVLAQSAFNQANSANVLAQSAFNQANSANVLAQSAFNQANSANVLAQSAFNQANSANVLAQSSYNKANSIVVYANSNVISLLSSFGTNTIVTTSNISAGNLVSTGTITTTGNGVGYSTGSGGTITQATSRTTGVTLNKPSGQITLFSQALASGAANTFIFTNSTISANDFLLINHFSGGTLGNYTFASNTSTGQANVTVRSISTVSAEAPVLQYVLIKGAAS